jgi:hypothetical protein
MSDHPAGHNSLRYATAIHEAGHAVVAWALGLKVRSLSVGEAGKGKSCIEDPGHLPLTDRIAVAAAGMAATDLLHLPGWHEAGFSDEAKIVNLLDQYSDDEDARDRMGNAGHARAREILGNKRRALSDLAVAQGSTGMLDEIALAPFALRDA